MRHPIRQGAGVARHSLAAMFTASLFMVLGGCGDDPPAKKQRKPAQARGAQGAAPAPAAAVALPGTKGSVQKYNKISEALRRTFLEKDFRPDPDGDGNRDPFRSYVIRQPGADDNTTTDGGDNELCQNTKKKKNWKAPSYSIRDLTLIGIIMRGTKGYAQFLDRSGEGWIVTQNNCLGAEKAIVSSIGSGVVRLQVRPEAPVGGTAPAPVARDIPLYPKEYEIETD